MKPSGSDWLWAGLVLNVACSLESTNGLRPQPTSENAATKLGTDAETSQPQAQTVVPDGPMVSLQAEGGIAEVTLGNPQTAAIGDPPTDAGLVPDSSGATRSESTPLVSSEHETLTAEQSEVDAAVSQASGAPISSPIDGPEAGFDGGFEATASLDVGPVTVPAVDADSGAVTSVVEAPVTVPAVDGDSSAVTSIDLDLDTTAFDAGPATAVSGASDGTTTPLDDAGAIGLTSLQFGGAHTSLYPAFAPDRFRYSIIAESNAAVLSVIATASGATQLRVNGVEFLPEVYTDVAGVSPGSEVVVSVGEEPNVTRYFVQYLPVNFPDLRVDNPYPGASDEPLYVSLSQGDGQFVAKLDQAGVPLFYKQESSRVYDFKKHPDGTLSYAARRPTASDGSFQVRLNSQFQELARLSAVGLVNTDVHDFLVLPNGNNVFVSYEPAVHDLSAFGLSATEKVVDSIFQEVNSQQQVVFQWNSWDHVQYDQSVYALRNRDYAHANSVVEDHDGHWLLSLRGFSQVLKIERTTGEVLWRLGGVDSDFTFVNDPFNGFCGQHTATRLDNGHILLFDNARECLPEVLGSRPDRSRAVEYSLDEVAMTAELVWSYERDGLVAASQGSAQRLSNGNTMIGWGSGPTLLATEVTEGGQVVFELSGRARDNSRVSSYRARRFAD